MRLGTILTDAELEPDPILEPGALCNRCMRCAEECPGGAIPRPGERPPAPANETTDPAKPPIENPKAANPIVTKTARNKTIPICSPTDRT